MKEFVNDHWDLALQQRVRPSDWTNPSVHRRYQLLVIGAGTAGLVAAAGAAALGARVAIVERDFMGGDCLNFGCVPSKALLRAAKEVRAGRQVERLGAPPLLQADVDFALVMDRLRRTRAEISPADSADRFQSLGVDVYFGNARFVDETKVQVVSDKHGDRLLGFSRAVIATGSSPRLLDIKGLEERIILTNENVFALQKLPSDLAIIGAGPIGVELASAFAMLGSKVHLIEHGTRILSNDDEDAARVVHDQLMRDGVNIRNETKVTSANAASEQSIELSLEVSGKPSSIASLKVEKVLMATGRVANITDLDLQRANVETNEGGVKVNDFLQTSNPRIYSAGDVCFSQKFTHVADFLARIAIQNALFAVGPIGRKRASSLVIPHVTYCYPELAHVGLTDNQANKMGWETDVFLQPFEESDRAMIEGCPEGFVKLVAKKGTDKLLGATIVGENAGELITEIVLAMTHGIGIRKLVSTIHSYPTMSDSIRRAADQYNRTRLTPWTMRFLSTILRWNVGG